MLACLHLCSVENCIKEENEEDFVQLLADHSPYNGDCVKDSIPAGLTLLFHESSRWTGRDATESFSPFHGDLPHISKTSESLPVNYCINAESTRKAIEGDDNRHAVGHSVGQGIAGNMKEMFAVGEIRKLFNDVLPQACVDITTVKNVLNADIAQSNRQVQYVDGRCSIRPGLAQGIAGNMSEENDVCDLTDVTGKPERHSNSVVVNSHHVVEACTSQGPSRPDDGENASETVPLLSYSAAGEEGYNCIVCGVFLTKKSLTQHMTTHGRHQCIVCGQMFAKYYLKVHMRIHSGAKPYSCSLCGMKFRVLCLLKYHENRHKGELSQCHLCGSRVISLDHHMVSVHADKSSYRYSCSVCRKLFRLESLLKRHMSTHTDERPYVCQECRGRFRTLSHLKTHIATHTKEKKHACTVCGKKFLQRAAVKIHMRVHTGERPFHCETCGGSFATSGTLDAHQATHSSERSFICRTCGKGFRLSYHLNRHSLIHSGEQPHECSECGMRFNQSCSLQRHMLTHTGEKPYSCADCGQRFTQSGGLCSHRRRHCHAKKAQT